MGRSPNKKRRAGKGSKRRRSPASAKRVAKGAKKKAAQSAAKPVRRRASSGTDSKAEIAKLSRELSAAQQRQAATSEVLQVISSSPGDLKPVFEQMLAKAMRLCEAQCGFIYQGEQGAMRAVAEIGVPRAFAEYRRQHLHTGGAATPIDAMRATRKPAHVHDARDSEPYRSGNPNAVAGVDLGGARTVLYVPMIRNDDIVGVINLYRQEVRPFTDEQIALLENFASQAVIAIENARLFNETREALERQTATSDILQVIASSPSDVQPVFDAIAESARRVIGGHSSLVTRVVGDQLHLAAFTAGSEAGREKLTSTYPQPLSSPVMSARVVRTGKVFFYADTEQGADEITKGFARARGYRSVVSVPMLRDGAAIGTINVTRVEPGEFSDNTVGLLKTFADQAVIAIENARLFNETREALERQTATADILRVIASSPDDVQPVFQAIADRSNRLVNALSTTVFTLSDGIMDLQAFTPVSPEADATLKATFPAPLTTFSWGASIGRGEMYSVIDAEQDPELSDLARERGWRSCLCVPLLRDGKVIGMIGPTRVGPGRFTEHHVQLMQTFADQAVIAIENTRLFNETREALARQTATADVLKVIASSPSNLQPVFDAIAERSKELVGGHSTTVFRFAGDMVELVAATSVNAEADAVLRAGFPRPIPAMQGLERTFRGEMVETVDAAADTESESNRNIARARGFRSRLVVPLNSDNGVIGAISITRSEPGAFANKDVELLRTFADQAVIAIQNVKLFEEVQAKTRDLEESLQQQTATADVLKVISRSAFDLDTVMDTLASSARDLCGSEGAALFLREGDALICRGISSATQAERELLRANPVPLNDASHMGLAVLTGTVVNIGDVENHPKLGKFQRAMGFKAFLAVPLMREGRSVGVFTLTRFVVGEFTPRQVELVQTFADQAVIAVENTRLFDETREALARQTATADVLKVIASSPSNLQPVFDAIAERSKALIGAHSTTVVRYIGGKMELASFTPVNPEADAVLRAMFPMRPTAGDPQTEQILRGEIARIADAESELQNLAMRDTARARGWRSRLLVPLKDDTGVIGWISIARKEAGPFADKDVELLQTFADQAVIAIQNVRLFEEVQAKTRDLEESLQQQTATADVLKVISRSAFDLETVLTTLVESAARLCEADEGIILQPKGDGFGLVADWGLKPGKKEFLQEIVFRPTDGRLTGRVLAESKVVHIHDVLNEPDFVVAGDPDPARTRLGLPLLRDGTPIGVFVLTRRQTAPFTNRQIELVETFADQAVIAISNVELFQQVQARTRDLQESLEQQTATAEILSSISGSMNDTKPVFDAIVRNLLRLFGTRFAVVQTLDQGIVEMPAVDGEPGFERLRERYPRPLAPDTVGGIAMLEKRTLQFHPVLGNPAAPATTQQFARDFGFDSVLFNPMLSGDKVVGAIGVARHEAVPFDDKQIALIASFANQAVIAIENTRLLRALQERTDALTRSLDDLRAAQDRLVQTEKLASLGQLTAGIAHEIKNPLNFINNFSALSVELTDELNDALKQAELAEKIKQEVGELTQLLKSNLEKVVQHGKRADSIVKNMLLHSREGSGEQRAADVNALVEESLNLAYHGARAEKSGFDIALQREFDAGAGSAELYPQEITRALLNLISNGFYAATRRKAENGDGGFEPTLLATTKDRGTSVEIRIRDNGTGIPPEVKEKMFNPFFTTKPAGEGTGLGLSMTHDIIVKQHGGTIDVATEPGNFTEFIVVLPRANGVQKNRGQT